jgi:hypothetical protein
MISKWLPSVGVLQGQAMGKVMGADVQAQFQVGNLVRSLVDICISVSGKSFTA